VARAGIRQRDPGKFRPVGERGTDKEATGVNHFCLQVDGIESVVDDLVSRGVVITRELREGPDGNRQAWIEHPDGVRIELMEMKPGCIQFEAVRRLELGSSRWLSKRIECLNCQLRKCAAAYFEYGRGYRP
jgi:hypothetical protein